MHLFRSRKPISIVLALVMVLSMMPSSAFLVFAGPMPALTAEPGYVYPVAVELPMGLSTQSTGTPAAFNEASGRIRWYRNTWYGDAQVTTAFTRAHKTAANYLVVEYSVPPPAGNHLVLSSAFFDGAWGHTYAQAMALPEEHRVVVVADGVSTQYVLDLGAPYTKATQTAANTFSATASNFAMTVNTQNSFGPATRAYFANTRELVGPVTEAAFVSLAANGTANTITTDVLTITLSQAIEGFSAEDIAVTGATKSTLSGTGPVYTLAISDLTVGQGESVTVTLNKAGYHFTPASLSVAIHHDGVVPLVPLIITSSAAGGTAWPEMTGEPNSANPNGSPNANQVVTLTWPAVNDAAGETYSVWQSEGDSVPAVFVQSAVVPVRSGNNWTAAVTIKSATPYLFYVASSVRENSNIITQAARNGNIGPDQLVEIINRLPADPKLTTMENRYDLVRIRRVYQKLTRYDRELIREKLRHFEICEAYFLSDWSRGIYEQFKLAPGAAPAVSSAEYEKWRAAAEIVTGREGAQWFMRFGSRNVAEYGHNNMYRSDTELRQILIETGTTARLDRMDQLRDQFVEERKVIYKKVKEGVETQITAMDPSKPAEVAAARAAYDALTAREKTFVSNLARLIRAEGKSIVPPNVVGSGMRSSSYGPGSPWPSAVEWTAMNNKMKEYFPGTRSENIWIIGNLGSNASMDFGTGVNFNFSWASFLDNAEKNVPTLVDRTGSAANHTYRGKTQAQWLRDGVQFATNMADRHEDILSYFSSNDVYVFLQVEAGYADMQDIIDISFAMFKHHKSVVGFAIDCEWHMGATEDSGIQVTDAMARAWNLTMKAHGQQYVMALKDYEPTRLPWTYRGEPEHGYDLIFCHNSQSYGDIDGGTVGFYEAHGAWYNPETYFGRSGIGSFAARDGAPIGKQLHYQNWSAHFYPNDISFQFGYAGDRHWMAALDIPFEGLLNTPYPKVMSSLIAWQLPMDQKVSVAWVDFNLRGFTGFPDVWNYDAAGLGGHVNTALGLLGQNDNFSRGTHPNWIGHRFTNPNRDTLFGGGPVLNDAMYVRRMREMVNEADEKGWTGISAANRARLELLEPMAIDVRIDCLVEPEKIVSGHKELVQTIRADYEALTTVQKAQVTKLAILEAAELALAAAQEFRYAVRYDANGGTFPTNGGVDAYWSEEVQWTQSGLLPVHIPVREGYEFLGWKSELGMIPTNDMTYEELVGGNVTVTSFTMLAQWEVDVPITSIRIDSLSIATVARYGEYTFNVIVNDGANPGNIVWTIADPSLGYVDASGTITIFDKIGNVRLTASSPDGKVSHSITLRIAS